MSEIVFRALPKQLQFIRSRKREVLYSGAFGAGKSVAVCLKALARACTPGAREGLCRKHLVTLKATTLRTLLHGDGKMPPILPLGSYSHNKSEKIISIHGGGEIVYFGLDDIEKIGSYNLTGCGTEEAVELTEDDWSALRGRIRVPVDGLPNQLYGACNPGPPAHHLAKRFGLALGAQCADNCEAIQTRSSDNHHLPKEYLDDLATFTGLRKKRYVEGLWVGSDGLVYDRWDRQVHCLESHEPPPSRVIVGIDDGYTNPFVVLRLHVDSDGRAHIAREHYKSGLLMANKVAAVRALADGAEAVVVDPSAADLIAELRNAGLPVKPADNAVFDGIGQVQQRLEVAGDGKPRLTVDPTCANTMREIETYEWDKGKDKPVKENDHAMDALRYAVRHLDGTRRVILLTPGESADNVAKATQDVVSLPERYRQMREDPDWGFGD